MFFRFGFFVFAQTFNKKSAAMFFRRTKRPAPRPTSFRPRVEVLEQRAVPTATTTTLSVQPNPGIVNQAVTLTAIITGGDIPAALSSGSVTFMDGATLLKTVAESGGTA